ncbi:MAG: hypothetical protein MJ072_01735, partial [Clostridia bacterium]|nr:hypothetical protein [Clostridia bacterium]
GSGVYVAYGDAETVSDERSVKILISEKGEYHVVISDEYGNVWDKKVEILLTDFTVEKNVLTGWNERALKRSEGYTNTKLSINVDLLPQTVKFVALYLGEEKEILYDDISQKAVPFNGEAFKDILGNLGNGAYKIVFRDAYGNSFIREVHYSDKSTLVAERRTRANQENEIYADELLTDGTGLWTNSSFTLTGSECGILTVNGEAVDSPFEKAITQGVNRSYSEYAVTYLDEYGFSYSFKAYLSREDVEITLDSSVEILEKDDKVYTNNDIVFTFKDHVFCKYYLNGAGPYEYKSGDVMIKDGRYRFMLEDLAGNSTTYSIIRDTVCEYSLIEANTERRLVNGDAINNTARFVNLNGDQNFIGLALLNGVKQDVKDIRIDRDGKWELLITDELGNVSFFNFTVITHATNRFEYETPYGYTINSISRFYNETSEDLTKHEEVVKILDDDGKQIGNKFAFNENGVYFVIMSNGVGDIITFNFTIDLTKPKAEIVNVEEGGITRRDVSFNDLKVGDVIDIYKNGVLVKSEEYSIGSTSPVVSDAGEYRVVVTNIAGNQKEFHFTRKHVVNTAGNVLIITVSLILAIALMVGTVYRTKNKTDN